jgi:hypothetical protein
MAKGFTCFALRIWPPSFLTVVGKETHFAMADVSRHAFLVVKLPVVPVQTGIRFNIIGDVMSVIHTPVELPQSIAEISWEGIHHVISFVVSMQSRKII